MSGANHGSFIYDTIKVTVAQYVDKYGNEMVSDYEPDSWIENNKDYVRISEPVGVVFIPLSHETVLKLRLEALDQEIKSVRATAAATISNLEDQKQRLMAITHEPT